MPIRAAMVAALLSIFASSGCLADWLVLRGGKKIETSGVWGVNGNLLRIREADGRPKTFLLSIVDYDETLRANPRAAQPKDSAWHISAEGIRRLKETARVQEQMEARARAQQEMSAEMGSVAPKPGVAGAGATSGAAGQKPAGSAANGGYATKGMEGIARCAQFQDSPSAYSQCLAAY